MTDMPDTWGQTPCGETEVADFSGYLNPERDVIFSNTGELVWNYELGVCRMNAPKAQGVAGFLKAAGGRFETLDCVISSGNEYASVTVVSLDDRPISESRRILVQVGTTARLDGWETAPETFDFKGEPIDGLRIVNSGKPPWRIANTDVNLRMRNGVISRITRLTVGGRAAENVGFDRAGDLLGLDLPADTMYLLLEAE